MFYNLLIYFEVHMKLIHTKKNNATQHIGEIFDTSIIL